MAHEIAMKAAETDATKRALATFGNPFGLALYDKDKLQVTRSRRNASQSGAHERSTTTAATIAQTYVLVRHDGARARFATAEPFIDAMLKSVQTLPTLEALYAFWEANLEGLGWLRVQATTSEHDPLQAVIAPLKARAHLLGCAAAAPDQTTPGAVADHLSALAAPKDRRLRSK